MRCQLHRIAVILIGLVLVAVVGYGCLPDENSVDPPQPAPPVATACGLIGRDCNVLAGSQPVAVVSEDLDGDGDYDLAVAMFGSDKVEILMNDGTGVFTRTGIQDAGDNPTSLAAGDFDLDGDVDLAVASLLPVIGPGLRVLLNNGDASFVDGGDFRVAGVPWYVTSGDADNDGDLDLIASSAIGNVISILVNDRSGEFSWAGDIAMSGGPVWSTLADINSDTRPDLVVAHRSSNEVSAHINQAEAGFAELDRFDVCDTPTSVVAGDFDANGAADLIVTCKAGFADDEPDVASVLLNNGTGDFSIQNTLAVGVNPNASAVGDLDDDGDLDVAVVNTGTWEGDSNLAVLLNDGSGSFEVSIWPTDGGPESVALADLDGDGDLDAVTANRGSNTISLLANDGLGRFYDQSE